MDFLEVVSNGLYTTLTLTARQKAMFFASWGLTGFSIAHWSAGFGMGMDMNL